MIVQLRGTQSGLSVQFTDAFTYNGLYGYNQTFSCYNENVNETLTFRGWNFAGFFNSLGISSESDKGAGEIGSAWRGNSFGEKLITWNFQPVIHGRNGRSPQSVLNAMIVANDIIEVTVEGKYKSEFYFISDTSTESGVISMASADTNDGVMWDAGDLEYKYYLLEKYPYLPKLLPKELLKTEDLVITTDIMSESQHNPLIEISGQVNGFWNNFTLTTKEQVIFYDNSVNQDTKIFIDSENKVIFNQNGIDRSEEIQIIEGITKYPTVYPGLNAWEFKIDMQFSDEKLFRTIPTDMLFSVKIKNLTSTIVLELN